VAIPSSDAEKLTQDALSPAFKRGELFAPCQHNFFHDFQGCFEYGVWSLLRCIPIEGPYF
jgi:hypothetical protein